MWLCSVRLRFSTTRTFSIVGRVPGLARLLRTAKSIRKRARARRELSRRNTICQIIRRSGR
jgi:uncharacterized protein YjiS (DUF1127 family)